jgi:hypothetical protein
MLQQRRHRLPLDWRGSVPAIFCQVRQQLWVYQQHLFNISCCRSGCCCCCDGSGIFAAALFFVLRLLLLLLLLVVWSVSQFVRFL